MIKKKRGLGKGFFNGPGGKLDSGETPLECVIREVEEEIGVKPIKPLNLGLLDFYFGDKEFIDWKVHVYVTHSYTGVPKETEEAKPYWFETSKIPFEKMWEDDQFWLPEVLNEKYVRGKFYFSKDMKKLLDFTIETSNSSKHIQS